MSISFKRTRLQRYIQDLRTIRARALDALYSPVISRLTDEEYFSCRTHNDCLRTYLRSRINAASAS